MAILAPLVLKIERANVGQAAGRRLVDCRHFVAKRWVGVEKGARRASRINVATRAWKRVRVTALLGGALGLAAGFLSLGQLAQLVLTGALGRVARLALLLAAGGVGGDLFGALFFAGLGLLQNGDTLFTLGGGEAVSGFVAERAFGGAAAIRRGGVVRNIAVGDAIPAGTKLFTEFPDTTIDVPDRLAGKKTIIVGLPGAFTPT